MNYQTKGQKLQEAYRKQIEPYAKHLQFAVTLTLKQSAKIRIKRFTNYGDEYFEYTHKLDEDRLNGDISYFSRLLTQYLYGNQSKHKNKQAWAKPLIIAAIEGRNTSKRTHLHLAIGNIPTAKLATMDVIVKQAWERCDFANKQVCVKPLTDNFGWLCYITKEVGYTDDDALDIVSSTIPPFIQHSICTESRLLAA